MALEDLELKGNEKDTVLKKIHSVADSWGLKIPDVTPSPLHFGKDDFYDVGETEFDINNNVKEGYCGKFIFQFKNQTCPMHHHAMKHETFYIVKGRVEMTTKDESIILEQGDIYIMPQYTWHTFTALEDSLILESSKPDIAEDSIFEDDSINQLMKA